MWHSKAETLTVCMPVNSGRKSKTRFRPDKIRAETNLKRDGVCGSLATCKLFAYFSE